MSSEKLIRNDKDTGLDLSCVSSGQNRLQPDLNKRMIERLERESRGFQGMVLQQKYVQLRTSWGIYIGLEMRAVPEPVLNADDSLIDDSVYLRISNRRRLNAGKGN